MILKLFQPVWGNQRQSWNGDNVLLLMAMGLFGAIPCSLMGWLVHSQCSLTPSYGFWGLVGFLASLYACWVAGKVNLEWMIGDAAVHPHGTCHMAQANLFHRERAQSAGFLEHLKNHSIHGSFIDLSICEFFLGKGPMWTTSPSLFQHGGLKTSLPNKVGTRTCRIRIFHEGLFRTRVEQRRVWYSLKLFWRNTRRAICVSSVCLFPVNILRLLAVTTPQLAQVLLGELKGGLSFEAHSLSFASLESPHKGSL